MSLVLFLEQLGETGEVVIVGLDPPDDDQRRLASDALAQLDRDARLRAPGLAPPLDRLAATWAAVLLYRACQFLAFRDIPAEQVTADLAAPCPSPVGPSSAWSVDLTLSHLPRLLTLARGLSPDDPLVSSLRTLAADWPLSSVGADLSDDAHIDIDPIWPNRCLRQLYVDRIIERADHARTADPRVAGWIRRSLGLFGDELAPAFANLCEKEVTP